MDTRTSYLGLRLAHPFVAGASPLGYQIDAIRQIEDTGWAAIVLPSLFEEQITASAAPFPDPGDYRLRPDQYAEHVYRVKQAVSIPVIGSLNGHTAESWIQFAQAIEQAGADALELNMYEVPTDLATSGAEVEARIVGAVGELRRLVTVPLAVKLSPYFTAFGHVARALDAAGADGLVLFNRFYQPDIDVHAMRVVPHVELSNSSELTLRLHWVAILHGRIRPSLGLSGGVVTPEDAIKAILAGADVVQQVSAILRDGPSVVAVMRRGLDDWMAAEHIVTLDEVRGAASLQRTADRGAFERAQYIRTLQSWTR